MIPSRTASRALCGPSINTQCKKWHSYWPSQLFANGPYYISLTADADILSMAPALRHATQALASVGNYARIPSVTEFRDAQSADRRILDRVVTYSPIETPTAHGLDLDLCRVGLDRTNDFLELPSLVQVCDFVLRTDKFIVYEQLWVYTFFA